MRYIKIKNLDDYQHYKDRNITWIKWHIAKMDHKFDSLCAGSKWTFVCLIGLACRNKNKIEFDIDWLHKEISYTDSKINVKEWIDTLMDREMIAECYQNDSPIRKEEIRREEIREEKKRKEGDKIEIPEDLKEHKEIIETWLKYKKEKGQSYKPTGLNALWIKLKAIPKNKLKESIAHSMANNWAGVFENKGGDNGRIKIEAGKYDNVCDM